MNLVINDYNKKYEISLGNVTQVLGVNYRGKKYICDSIVKHFSSYKYQEFDEYMEENIKIDDEQPGRNEYRIINIKDRETLLEQMRMSKTTLVYEYLKNLLETLSCQRQLNALDANLTQIYMLINEKLKSEIGNISIEYEMQSLLNIVSKSEILTIDGTEIENLKNVDILKILLELVKENNKYNPEKIIILCQNIDHILTKSEYKSIISSLLDYDKNVYFMLFLSTDNYVYLNREIICYVTVFNNTLFQVPNYDVLERFIADHYPINYSFEEEELLLVLQKVLNGVGIENYNISYKELLIKKMINKALCINDSYDFDMLKSELTCLNKK